MASKPKYLIQEIEGKKPFIYAWTPVLAKKKDMRPISTKEAEKILSRQKAAATVRKENWQTDQSEQNKAREILDEEEKERREAAKAEEFISDDEDNKILDTLEPSATTQTSSDQSKKLEITQEDILSDDVTQINRLRKTASVEEFMLKKYKIEMLAMESITEMKQQAIDTLKALAATGSLYNK